MKCIILCAGYATRLQKYIENTPKALITIDNKPIINYLIEEVEKIEEINQVYIVSNAIYYDQFLQWQKNIKSTKPIKIINNGTSKNEERLGAIGDIKYAIDHEKIEDDIMIMASDNFFDFDLREMVELFHQKEGAIICTKQIEDKELLRRLAVVTVNDEGKVTKLIEKPQEPEGDRGVYTTYVYRKEVIQLLNQYIKEGNNSDAPGYFVQWLYKIYPVYSYDIKGDCYDIGNYETLSQVREKYSKGCNDEKDNI